ncbi:MAG: methionine--tRNA ligase, partial [Candidatus Nanohaloarchaea archaeon]|nr:methionine--tRNA ligase [Candidatus Nanohaloarchaea archaeon]
MADRKIVTSALPYIHGVPHLGNLVGSLLPADIYHRFLDVNGVENIYICGSDEHGTPLELAALEAGVPAEEHADAQHEKVKSVLEAFNMDFSLYGRTHTEYNRKQTHRMFRQLYRNGYITEKSQDLPYCRNCERFLPDRYIEGECPHCGGLARGDQCDECGKLVEPDEIHDPYCTICNQTDIEFQETKNLFLQLSLFEDQLKEWLKEHAPVPDSVKSEVLNLIDEGLEDRCITRDISWGFDVPTEEFDDLDDETYADKVLYVWFDAPIGYIGITRQYLDQKGREEEWEEFWRSSDAETIYSIGKDNTIFHAIIWPSILLGQQENYNMPDHEFIQQYLLAGEAHFSKSRGTGLTSEKALDLLPPDYWRFYLASVLPVHQDAEFSWEDLEAKINGELNDTIGNYVNRVLSLAEQWFEGTVPDIDPGELDDASREFLFGDEGVSELVKRYEDRMENKKALREGLDIAVGIARHGDEFLSAEEPWTDERRREPVIYACIQSLQALAACLYPFIPDASEQIWEMLNAPGDLVDGQDRLNRVREESSFLDPG